MEPVVFYCRAFSSLLGSIIRIIIRISAINQEYHYNEKKKKTIVQSSLKLNNDNAVIKNIIVRFKVITVKVPLVTGVKQIVV